MGSLRVWDGSVKREILVSATESLRVRKGLQSCRIRDRLYQTTPLRGGGDSINLLGLMWETRDPKK